VSERVSEWVSEWVGEWMSERVSEWVSERWKKKRTNNLFESTPNETFDWLESSRVNHTENGSETRWFQVHETVAGYQYTFLCKSLTEYLDAIDDNIGEFEYCERILLVLLVANEKKKKPQKNGEVRKENESRSSSHDIE